ncbi:hypothetical protein JCM18918_2264 [Cutibacterium acnes JCM 18918]|nr:hypothetical protein JCM18918_2264 [Cutibacterium acnes JCM 18918]
MGAQRGEKVVGLLELNASLLGRVLSDGRAEIRVGVEPVPTAVPPMASSRARESA